MKICKECHAVMSKNMLINGRCSCGGEVETYGEKKVEGVKIYEREKKEEKEWRASSH